MSLFVIDFLKNLFIVVSQDAGYSYDFLLCGILHLPGIDFIAGNLSL